MQFANPHLCPSCGGPIQGVPSCPGCGLDLTSVAVRQLWQTLLRADELLVEARAVRATQGSTTRATAPAHTAEPPLPHPQSLRPQQPQAAQPFRPYPSARTTGSGTTQQAEMSPRRNWSVGTIVLALGALGLIVAGFIFVTKSWGDLGLLGRTLILSGVTVVIGVLATWVTRRTLRASAEAVWAVFLALLTLDFFAGRHEGLAGLGQLAPGWACVLWGIVLLALGTLITASSRRHVMADLTSTSIGAAGGIALAGGGLVGATDDWDFFWSVFTAFVLTGLLGLAVRPARILLVTISARIVVAAFFLFAYGAALSELFARPALSELIEQRHGLPVLVMALAALAIGATVRIARIPAVVLATLALGLGAITPSGEAWSPEGIWLAIAAVAVVAALAGLGVRHDWGRGLRLGATVFLVALGLMFIAFLLAGFESIGRALDANWPGAWDRRMRLDSMEHLASWPVFVVLAASMLGAWLVARWPECARIRPAAGRIHCVLGGMAVFVAVIFTQPAVWVGAGILLLAAAALAGIQFRTAAWMIGVTSALLALAASALACYSQQVAAPAWLLAAVVLAVLAWADAPAALRHACAGLAVIGAVGGVAAAVDLTEVKDSVTALVACAAALAVLAAAGLLLRSQVVRPGVEIVAAVALLVTLVVDGTSGELSVRWSVAGAVIIALGFAVAGRRWYLWPGVSALIVAYILLIANRGFSFVEAYTLPLGAAALAIGLVLMRRHRTANSWLYLGAGLSLAMLPSMPQALADPVGLRALLLGVGAVVALGVGVRLGWQAPFVTGVTIVTLLVLFNLGPYANAAPRVVLIAAVSAVLLGLGITWEDRMREGRLLVTFVRSMR